MLPLLKQLAGAAAGPEDISAAVKGLLHAAQAVRAAALAALPVLPAFAAGAVPPMPSREQVDELVSVQSGDQGS